MPRRWKPSANARSAGVLLSAGHTEDAASQIEQVDSDDWKGSAQIAEDPEVVRRRARESAVRILGRREHSAKELIRKLKQRDFSEEIITETLNWLSSHGLLDENRFSAEYARSRALRGYGPLRIVQELRERGIAEEEARDALNSLELDWLEAAVAARQRKFGRALPVELSEIAKQQRFLQYRGFSVEQARNAVRNR